LLVEDRGCGFDAAARRRGGGIGLVVIEERARLVGGVATIDAHPDHGTTVAVRVPYAPART
jgi:signal transduction histidine kinase